jgi:hypothetical protein
MVLFRMLITGEGGSTGSSRHSGCPGHSTQTGKDSAGDETGQTFRLGRPAQAQCLARTYPGETDVKGAVPVFYWLFKFEVYLLAPQSGGR